MPSSISYSALTVSSLGTKLVENNPEEIVKEISQMTANSNELATCLPSGGMQYSYKYFFEIKKKLLEKKKRTTQRYKACYCYR